jgi:hypothetical protein
MPWAPDVHPEFGYLCLPARTRRRLRRTLACVVFGALAAAVLQSAHDLKSRHAESHGAIAMIHGEAGSGAPAERATRTRPLEAAAGATKTPCGRDERAALDGKCGSHQAPRMRVVRVPANRPAIAAVPIGRGAAPASTTGPVASVGAPEPARDHVAPPAQAAASEPAAEAAAWPPAAAKKPQKTAQNRRREAPAWREVRAEAWSAFAYERDRPRGIPFSPFW